MYRNMVTSLLDHERIQTTDAKAKEVRRVAERMITLGKRGTLHARRQALRVIRSRDVTAKVFDDLADRFRERPGGYTRVLKLGIRRGDAAPVSVVELVKEPLEVKETAKKAPAKKKTATKKATTKKATTKKATTSKAPAKKKATRKKKAGD